MTRNNKQAGFAHIAGLLLVLVVVIVGGVGVYVTRESSARRRPEIVKNLTQPGQEPAVGTVAAIDKLLQDEINEEIKTADELAAQEEAEALSEAQAVISAGDGYEIN